MKKIIEVYGQKLHQAPTEMFESCSGCIFVDRLDFCQQVNKALGKPCLSNYSIIWKADDPKAFEMAILLQGE